jgi:Tol biopolymer transport system component/tRNA A-37 threonylcarbamoyl transferase component Bud32
MIGQTILHYEIQEKLGEGGMGVVYKARDTKLDRLVALKFLPSHLNASEADKARFIQEAKAAAALSHPNICTIFGIDDHDGQLFIAMELVDGQTLRERRETLSFKQAIEIGIQIADGLSAAHEKGIVHRDIKPENIMVRKDGIVQIMDFGLAKLRSASSKINRLTKEGSTVGTAGYMSPEQVMGLDVDHRSDIFSFGVVLYEMLAGQLPFRGVHETALAYEIVNVDAPPLTSVKPDLDPQLDAVVLDCLEKDPKERCQSMAEVARDLRRVKRESTRQRHSRITAARPVYAPSAEIPVRNAEPPPKPGRLPWLLAGMFFLTTIAVAIFHVTQQPQEEKRVIRAQILPPDKTNFNMQVGGHLALSPDGLTVAFVATDSTGIDQLWVRAVSSLTALPLAGTEGAAYPFWSFDNRAIAFFTGSKLKKIDAKGGPTLTVCDAPSGRGGTWNQNGIIVFSPDANSPLLRVSASGGTPEQITAMDTTKREQSHRWPFFLPDGNHFLYVTQTASMANENDAIKVGALDKSVDSVIMRGNSNVEYASGYLLFVRQSTLMAQLFDPAELVCSGEAIPVVEQLQYSPARSRGMFASSRKGVLVFQTGDAQNLKLGIFDRTGNRVALADERGTAWVRFSPDGKSIAFSHLDPQSRSSNIWIRDLARGTSSRFTFEQGTDVAPRWSPRGDSIVFSSNRKKGRFDLFIKNATGTANEELLFESNLDKYTTDWSRDGRLLAFTTTGDPKTKFDLWLLSLAGDRKPISFLRTEFSEGAAAFSPDTRWLAYQSDETGRFEVYVRLVDGTGGKRQVSINGGTNAQWLPDGRGIVFSSADRKMMLATIRASEATFAVDSIRALFDYESRGIVGNVENVSPDGKTFIARVAEIRQTSVPISLVTNWDEDLKKK